MKKLLYILIFWLSTLSLMKAQNYLGKEKDSNPGDEQGTISSSDIHASQENRSATVGSSGSDIIPVSNATENNNVNILVREKFNEDFVDAADVQWVKWNQYDQAMFTINGQQETAYYDKNGDLLGTSQNKKFADLPIRGQDKIVRKYKGYNIGPVTLYNDISMSDIDITLWQTRFDDETLYFAELSKGNHKIVVSITPDGDVSFFRKLS